MKSKAAIIIDNLIIFIGVWLLSALIARYYVAKTLYVVLTATVLAMAAVLVVRFFSKKSGESKTDSFMARNITTYFLYKDSDFTLDYFFEALAQKYAGSEKKNGFIRVNDTIIVPALGESLSLKNTVFYYSEALRIKAKTLVILAPSIDKNLVGIKEKLTDLRLEIFLEDRTYKLLKSLDRLPKQEKGVKSSVKIKHLIENAFSPKRFKNYLLTSFVLIFGAYFSFYSLYFIIMASISITLAILSKLNLPHLLKKK